MQSGWTLGIPSVRSFPGQKDLAGYILTGFPGQMDFASQIVTGFPGQMDLAGQIATGFFKNPSHFWWPNPFGWVVLLRKPITIWKLGWPQKSDGFFKKPITIPWVLEKPITF